MNEHTPIYEPPLHAALCPGCDKAIFSMQHTELPRDCPTCDPRSPIEREAEEFANKAVCRMIDEGHYDQPNK